MSFLILLDHHGAVFKGWCVCVAVGSGKEVVLVSYAYRSLACNLHVLCLVRVLAEYCPKLRSLKVKHCHNVAESSLSVLRNRGVELDVEPLPQTALVLLQDMAGFAPFINLQI